MLKIRLRRMGSRHRPFYRVVVSDSRRTPTASALEEIGYYDPRKKPATLSIAVDRVDHWMSHGAQPSNTVRKLVQKARSTAAAAPPEAKAIEGEAAETKDKAVEKAAEATEAKLEAEEAAEVTEEKAEEAAETTEVKAEAEEAAEVTEEKAEEPAEAKEEKAEEAAETTEVSSASVADAADAEAGEKA